MGKAIIIFNMFIFVRLKYSFFTYNCGIINYLDYHTVSYFILIKYVYAYKIIYFITFKTLTSPSKQYYNTRIYKWKRTLLLLK